MASCSLCLTSKRLMLLITILGSLAALQLIACAELAASNGNGGDHAAASGEAKQLPKQTLMPVLVVKQKESEGKEKPDIFLLWLKPYEQFIPKQVMDMIDSNVRPQTEQISGQVLSQVPGAEDFYSQMSGFQSSLANMGGMQSILGGAAGGDGDSSNPLSSFFGRRR